MSVELTQSIITHYHYHNFGCFIRTKQQQTSAQGTTVYVLNPPPPICCKQLLSRMRHWYMGAVDCIEFS